MSSRQPLGYTLPVSPSGSSSLVRRPPWHFAGEVLVVEYLADADTVRRYLPEDLEPTGDGAAAVVFGEWSCVSGVEPAFVEPALGQHGECYIVLACEFEGRPCGRVAYGWVDKDVSLVRGLIQGFPKKLGSIAMTRPWSVGRHASRLTAGGHFGASLAASDRRLIDAEVTLTESVTAPPEIMIAPLIHSRVFPAWTPGGDDINELVVSESRQHEWTGVWSGRAELRFGSTPTDDIAALAPLEVKGAHRFEFAETLVGGRVVRGGGQLTRSVP